MNYVIEPIATIRSPFRQKFGVPRQSGIVSEADGWIEFFPPYDQSTLVEGLEDFSHLWMIFVFHACRGDGWRARVRPPRLGGNRRRGVLATRSPFRPNHLGLSVVELLEIDRQGGTRLHVAGLDVVDGTPIVDIKPYLPYCDLRPEADAKFGHERPNSGLAVRFDPCVAAQLKEQPRLRCLIRKTLELDPRPAYHAKADTPRRYGMKIAEYDVQIEIFHGTAAVIELLKVGSSR